VFPKLSKLLNQEVARAHPAYAVISALRSAPSGGAGTLRKYVFLHFDVTL
jgi:hypothetical protein